MFGKISEAFELLKSNLSMIASILCTIWFPVNLLLEYWGAVFKANFFAGLWTLLALFAFIIPGIVLAVRYSLIDSVVVLEELSATKSLRRSNQMTSGVALRIFGAILLLLSGFFVSVFVSDFPLEIFPALDNFVVSAVIDTVLDVVFSVITITLFLFYWEVRTQEEQWAEEGPELAAGEA